MMSWLPENISTYGGQIDHLFYLIYYLTSVTFILVAGCMIAFLVMYRHSDGRRATYTHGNTTLEIIWTIVPALILIMLGFMSKARWEEIKSPAHMPPPDLYVRVTAKQFNWEIRYPGPDGKFDTDDDLQVDNDLHVPLNKVVRVILRSKDVIHSFFVPQMRLKQDAVPGRDIQVWFQATKAGQYEIPCAELCGFGHSGMKGALFVQTKDDYDQWVKEQWPAPAAAPAAAAAQAPVAEARG
ncbi:MAG: cytochrome c oxidase subunit II [Deltaproteobacteria bacterium]|nr:cytochrome c oxidase subunit II [Deltaproteobacteria bacterium]MBI3389176.1 cytochrome c oxidase subunit II [Deltaproteobacteria bacterium]